jgi:hypothetical protein
MVTGCTQLSNWAARIRKVNNNPSANKVKVSLELSTYSRVSPSHA